ncbi:MAG: hypothetical protein HY330_04340 [Chloroflexi bacterium]|nr:hypothetical protein [Chloroflexota bacterium]
MSLPKPRRAGGRPATRTGPKQRLLVYLVQTDYPDADVDRLRRVVAALQKYPGLDEVRLSVVADGETTQLQIPHLGVRCCDELRAGLVEIVGPDSVATEQALV